VRCGGESVHIHHFGMYESEDENHDALREQPIQITDIVLSQRESNGVTESRCLAENATCDCKRLLNTLKVRSFDLSPLQRADFDLFNCRRALRKNS